MQVEQCFFCVPIAVITDPGGAEAQQAAESGQAQILYPNTEPWSRVLGFLG